MRSISSHQAFFLMAAGHSHCYFPNGDLTTEDIPCFPDEEVSPCCGDDTTCLANGLCLQTKTQILYRGTCTDHSWDSPNCPQFCTKNEFTGSGALDFGRSGIATWGCSDKWPGEGGLLCCDVNGFDPQFNRSCCPGLNAFNLFSIGSKLGTATSITLSSSSVSKISSTSSSPVSEISSTSPPRISLVNGIIYVDGSSISALPFTTALSSTDLTSSSFSIRSSSSSSFSSKTESATTLASAHSGTNGSAIAIPVSISIGAVMLVIFGILAYRHFGKKGRTVRKEVQRDPIVDTFESEMIHEPQEVPGQQEYELPTRARYLTQELSQPNNRNYNPQELSASQRTFS